MIDNIKNMRNKKITKGEVIQIKEEMTNIAEEFSKWLENIAEKYKWDKDDVQDLIKWFLI